MDTTIDGIYETKRQVQQQIESEEKEYAGEAIENPAATDTISGFSSSDIVTALHNNENGDAVLFKTLFKDKTLYDHSEGIWYLWEGNCWKVDKIEEVLLSVDRVVEVYARGVKYLTIQRVKAERSGSKQQALHHKDIIDLLLTRIRVLQSLKRRRNVLVLSAAGTGSLGIDGEGWDDKEMLLACSNGIIDLTTGECRPGKQSDYTN